MNESLRFYQDIVGLRLKRRMSPMPGTDIAFLGEGDEGTEVELIKNEKNMNPVYGRDISMGFETTSLEKEIDRIKAKGIVDIQGPFQPGPNVKFIYLTDPNGVRIQFVENVRK
jgi:lactoylglutathione lyase